MEKDTWNIGRVKSNGEVFGGEQYYKSNYVKGYKYVVATLLFSLGLWALFYNLGVRM